MQAVLWGETEIWNGMDLGLGWQRPGIGSGM